MNTLHRILLFASISLFSIACTTEDVVVGASPADRTRTASSSVTSSGTSSNTTNSTSNVSTASSDNSVNAPTPLAQSSSNGSNCGRLYSTAPRGLACLHCTQPEAQFQAKQIRSVLEASCLRNIAINYLVDGTFSFDHSFLIDEITSLTSGGRQLFISFYLSNGPAQRRYDTTDIHSFGTKISPEEFRRRIQGDVSLQGEYQIIVDRLVPVIRYARQRGASVGLIPMLEDNLNDQAFQSMVELTLAVVPPELTVGIGRNPCPNCYPGNEAGIPGGVFEEFHTDWSGLVSATGRPVSGGIITNDGRDYTSPAQPRPEAETTLNELTTVRDAAGANNNSFILWSAARQGLQHTGGDFPNPAYRSYSPITNTEQRELVSFLRE
jgi:hypothetical protein